MAANMYWRMDGFATGRTEFGETSVTLPRWWMSQHVERDGGSVDGAPCLARQVLLVGGSGG